MQLPDAKLTEWRERKLGEVPRVFLDAIYENVRVNGVVLTGALLIAIGALPNGKRTVRSLNVPLSEVEVHWRDFQFQPGQNLLDLLSPNVSRANKC